MDNNQDYVGNGVAATLVSVIAGVIGWVGTFDLADVVKIGSMALSGGAAVLAGIYWWYAIKEKRMDIKRKQNQ